jgi:hypothetical protein
MSSSNPITVEIPREHFWRGQLPHLLLLAGLLPGVWAIAGPALGDGQWLGVSDRWWCFFALAVPIVQQLLVALIWRAQLTHQVLTRRGSTLKHGAPKCRDRSSTVVFSR